MGDLVHLRRLAQDNQKSHKLESRWEGLYTCCKVEKISNYKRSVYLDDLHSGKRKGKSHVNEVALYRQRKPTGDIQEETWMSRCLYYHAKAHEFSEAWYLTISKCRAKHLVNVYPLLGSLGRTERKHNHPSFRCSSGSLPDDGGREHPHIL